MAAHSDIPFKRLPVKIIGTGSYVPERRLTNADLEKMVDTSHEWIIERTGIVERRIAAPDEYTSHMGTKAAQRALESCGLKPEDIDLTDLDMDMDTLKSILKVDKDIWEKEAAEIEEHYKKFGDKLPHELKEQLENLKANLAKM